ncbi:hypothetical protein Btru_037399 [Bulinus truncatus]|nr:hypothetical protein Btru_037399 [Bulinus truncatus]
MVKIHVNFWAKYDKLREVLLNTFGPGEIKVTGEGDPQYVGWFDVYVDDKLIHSKKAGDGFVHHTDKMEKIIRAIKEALNKKLAFSYFFLTAPATKLGLPLNCDRRNGCQGTRYLLRSMRLRYQAFRQDLLDSLDPGEIEVTGEATPNSTSWFEVTVNGKLIHSKKNGDGFHLKPLSLEFDHSRDLIMTGYD